MATPSRGLSIAERLERLSIPEPNSGCLLWLGNTWSDEYPAIGIDGVKRGAHRIVLERKLGRALMPGEEACHKCDVTLCINEDHLFPGTHLDNMRDMKVKGRGRPGLTKLTPRQVLSIRSDQRPTRVIAQDYGVARNTISTIQLGQSWARLPGKRTATRASQHGTFNSNAVLTEEAVRAIRVDTRPQRIIAREYGIHQGTVSAIKTRKNWAHVQ